MSLKSFFTGESNEKVRYAIVALGDISQEAMMPGVEHTGNSTITAFVTGNPEKAEVLKKKYGVERSYTYEQFDELLNSKTIDAIYLATPNWRHAEFVIPALRAGIHVLVEKPLEISVEKCQEIMDVQKQCSAKLMVAYRLHFEPSTLAMIERLRNQDLGELRYFTANFSQMVDPANHRSTNGELAGPIFDMGPYPINAARYVFEDEPTEVISATALNYSDSLLANANDTMAVTLRFPRERLAQFVVSYSASAINNFTVVGTAGSLEMNPGFTYGAPMEQFLKIDGKESVETFSATDQFGSELKYFSDCILKDLDPEPDTEEGLADVRVIEGILEAARTGSSVKLPPFTRSRRIDTNTQLEKLRTVSIPEPVGASSPSLS